MLSEVAIALAALVAVAVYHDSIIDFLEGIEALVIKAITVLKLVWMLQKKSRKS
jgi:hypothetical protein